MTERKAKIICTLGPASLDPRVVYSLVEKGMDVARLNFSHGDHEGHKRAIGLVREAAARYKRPVAILQDLQGIKIRTGRIAGGSVYLEKGSTVTLMHGKGLGNQSSIYINCPDLVKKARKGDMITLDDGLIQMEVTSKTRDSLKAAVLESGVLKDRKGVNLPFSTEAPSFTEKDAADLSFGLAMGLDYVALSFVRSAEDLERVEDWFRKRKKRIPLIAKIERAEALANIEEILDKADGIMIARGDLGLDLPAEEIPLIQKKLISLSNRRGKLVITATQMLESMTEHSSPTRAEATDVANAVLDGTDALMLSAETASGKYPVEALVMMSKIIRYTEKEAPAQASVFGFPEGRPASLGAVRETAASIEDALFSGAVADAACRAAEDIGARFIVACTDSGFTARLVSKFRPHIPIIAFTPEACTLNRMALFWGVQPKLMPAPTGTDKMIKEVEKLLVAEDLVKKGERVVITASAPLLGSGKTNLLKLQRIGEDSARAKRD
ncbi:MAG: pyruvate kinase [Thermodesulfovibrio sp.]|nr:pyruvate kinase [Thermodesulfovibrio sp.]